MSSLKDCRYNDTIHQCVELQYYLADTKRYINTDGMQPNDAQIESILKQLLVKGRNSLFLTGLNMYDENGLAHPPIPGIDPFDGYGSGNASSDPFLGSQATAVHLSIYLGVLWHGSEEL